jgi:FixJ family two-component response regulator
MTGQRAENIAGNGEYVAVIDDDLSCREAIHGLLSVYGFSPSLFESALDFIRQADLNPFSCIVTDAQMPGMTGVELLDWLQRERLTTPTIIMSGDSRGGQTREAVLACGAVAFLEKPFDPVCLLFCVAQAVRAPRASEAPVGL